MRSATLYMQRGNYLSAIIIIKGLVGSSRQLFPSWQWSTLFSLFFFFFFVLSRSCFACISVPFFFQTVLFYFFLFSSRVFFSRYSLGNNSARCNRCSLSKEKLVEWGGEFFFNRISLLLPFRCLEISLFFLSSFFRKNLNLR